MWNLMFSHQCCWRFPLSDIWCHVVGNYSSSCAFGTLWNTHQVTRHHVPEGLNLHFLFILHVDPVQETFRTPKMGHNSDDAHIHEEHISLSITLHVSYPVIHELTSYCEIWCSHANAAEDSHVLRFEVMLLDIIVPRVPSEHCELHTQWQTTMSQKA